MEYNTVPLFKVLLPRYVLGFASHYIVDFIILSWVHFCLWGGACERGPEVLAGYLPWSFYTLLFGNLPLNLKFTYLVRVAGQPASRNSLSLLASTPWAGVTDSPRGVGLKCVSGIPRQAFNACRALLLCDLPNSAHVHTF